jgi:hypothetical protein
LLLGIGLPDENEHAPDEKLGLDSLHHGMLSAAYHWNELAEARLGNSRPNTPANNKGPEGRRNPPGLSLFRSTSRKLPVVRNLGGRALSFS